MRRRRRAAIAVLAAAAPLLSGRASASPRADGPIDAALALLGDPRSAARRERGARDLAALGPAARAALLAAIDPSSPRGAEPRVRALAVEILGGALEADAAGEAARAVRRAAGSDPAWEAREAAIRALPPGSAASLETLVAAAADPIYVVRRAAARALAAHRDDARARAALRRLEDDPDPDVADAARRAALPEGAARILDAARTGSVPAGTVAAALVLGAGDALRPELERWAARPSGADLRLLAASSLARLGTPPSAETLDASLAAAASGRPSAERVARRVLSRAGASAAALARARFASGAALSPRATAVLVETIVASLRAAAAPALAELLALPSLARDSRLALRHALASLPGGLGLPHLRGELADEADPEERLRLAHAFALRADDALAGEILAPLLGDASRAVRLAALLRLVASGRRDLLARAPEILAGSPEESVLRQFLRALPPIDPDAPAALLSPLLAHADPAVREEALVALGSARRAARDEVRAACAAALSDPAPPVRLAALNVLATRLEDESDPILRRIAAEPGDEAPRLLALRRLGPRGSDENAATLERIALDGAASDALRHGAIRALGENGSEIAARALRAAIGKPADRAVAIRAAAGRHVSRLRGDLAGVARDPAADLFDRLEALEALGRVPAESLPIDVFAPFLRLGAEGGPDGYEIASAAVRALGERGDAAALPLLSPLLSGAPGPSDGAGPADRADVLAALARIGSPEALERLVTELAACGEEPEGDEFRALSGALRGAPEAELARLCARRSALPPGDAERLSLPERSLEAIARDRRSPAASPLARFALERITATFPHRSAADRRAAGELAKEAIRSGDAAAASRWLEIEAAAGIASGAFEEEEDPFDARFPSRSTRALATLFGALAAEPPDAAAIDAAAAIALREAAADRGGLVTAGRALLDAGRLEAASGAAKKALDADPLDRDALRLSAEAELLLLRTESAAERLEALVFGPGGESGADAPACVELARIHFARGERPRALAYLREAALRDPALVTSLGEAGAFAEAVGASELDALVAPYRR